MRKLLNKKAGASGRGAMRLMSAAVFLSLFLSIILPAGFSFAAEGGGTQNVPATEIYRNRKLLEKTVKDLDAFRLMLGYMADHRDDSNRLLLMDEADRYMDKYVNPMIEERSIYHPATYDLAATLVFFKAWVYFEGGNSGEFKRVTAGMKELLGEKYRDVPLDGYRGGYKTIGEAIETLNKLKL